MATAYIKKNSGKSLKSGSSWIYDNEIERVDGAFENGDIIDVRDFDEYPLGKGFINTESKIAIRMMTRDINREINDEFLRMRITDAWNYRKEVLGFSHGEKGDTGSCRLIFGEADSLPGITIDKYEDVLVVESLALGIDRLKIRIINILKDVLAKDGITIRGVYERSDAKVRELEGLERIKGFIGESFDTKVQIEENGVKYYADVMDGQKTGFFLDQKYNRRAIARLCRGKNVLDCFTHTGSFALNAACAGAAHVIAADASELAIKQARENAALNHVEDRTEFVVTDIFDFLPELENDGKKFDVVILDPPAFTKSRETIKKAVKGYREINMRGLRLVKDGGYLATCSCSHFMDEELFLRTIREAAGLAHKRLKQVEFRQQSPDHPILIAGDENSYYLKFVIYQVTDEEKSVC